MKNQIKLIATALITAGVCICSAKPSMGQKAVSQKTDAHFEDVTVHSDKVVYRQTEANTRQSPHERNAKLIGDFLKTTDEKAAFDLLRPIKNGLTEEMAASKREILTAHQSNNQQAAKKAEQFNKELAEIYNTVVQKSRSVDSFDKNAIDRVFAKYQELKVQAD